MKKLLYILIALLPLKGLTQTITDGLMMQKSDLCTGLLYNHERWTDYWEGKLKRSNENIGTLTMQSVTWVGTYGITDNINIIAMVPYVSTKASKGTLHSMEGVQDLTLALKYNIFRAALANSTLKTFAALAVSTPLSDYTPDFYPLSIGTATTNVSWRLSSYYKLSQGLYTNVTGAYTWRSNTTLDRPAYYTDGKLYMTDEVKMPNILDFTVSVGYLKSGLQTEIWYMQQNTLGGDDIRRQDMPFVSNRMNFSKVGALVMYYLPKPNGLAVRGNVGVTVAGRNAGAALNAMGGLLYTIHFSKNTNP